MERRAAASIAALTQGPHIAVHAVNQATIDVADFHSQTPLTEIVFRRIGTIEASQVQNTDIHRGQRDIGGFTFCYALYLNTHIQGTARRDFVCGL